MNQNLTRIIFTRKFHIGIVKPRTSEIEFGPQSPKVSCPRLELIIYSFFFLLLLSTVKIIYRCFTRLELIVYV